MSREPESDNDNRWPKTLGLAAAVERYTLLEGRESRAQAPAPDNSRCLQEFHVAWKIDVHADSPEQAARLAWEIMRKPGSMADVFDVVTDGQEPVRVDLTEIDQKRASA